MNIFEAFPSMVRSWFATTTSYSPHCRPMHLLLPLFSLLAMAPKIKLTYFDIEGAAEPVRLALILSGTSFEDDRIKFPEWKELKPKTPYGAVPVMSIDDGPLRTQSMAMLRWVGSSFSDTLYPREKMFDIEESIGLIEDMSKSWLPKFYIAMRPESFGYPEGFAQTEEGKKKVKEMRENWVKDDLPRFLKFMEDKLTGKDWIAGGDAPTIADCLAVPTLRAFTRGHMDHVASTCLDDHPTIVAYIKRFCALPEIAGRYDNGVY
jgi:glutathione S-transferase